MAISQQHLEIFAVEARRLRSQTEPTLYPAYRTLIRASYPAAGPVHVDSNRHVTGTGFPDLTVLNGSVCLNWFEIKSPGVDILSLPATDQGRFDNYKRTLPHVVLTNGHKWLLFENGVEIKRLTLPEQWILGSYTLTATEALRLTHFLDTAAGLVPVNATTKDEAVELLATAANLIRLTVESCEESDYPTPLNAARDSFTNLLRMNPSDSTAMNASDFADSLAQTTVFGYLLARMEAGRRVSPVTAADALSIDVHPFLKNSLYGLMAPEPAMETLLKGPLRAACDMVNRAAPRLIGPGGDWSSVTYVYEDFFAAYRPADRFKHGVFYTPMEVTRYQVREVSRILRQDFGLDGLTDPAVQFLDPACGTGTYLIALAELAAEEAIDPTRSLPVGSTLHDLFVERVIGFEVSPGAACVAQARLAAWLKSRNVQVTERLGIYTVNSLTPAAQGTSSVTGNLWADNISAEQAAGDRVKSETAVLVVLGNPPWGRRDRQLFDIGGNQNLLASWSAGAAGAAQSVFDLYVAFWRLATEILLERPSVQPAQGIVSFITNRTWLRGRPFSSMRRYLRSAGAVAWVTDLGGDVRAGAGELGSDAGVFAIKAGSAIASVAFGGNSDPAVHYRRLLGTRGQKLADLSNSEPVWRIGPRGDTDPMALVDWGPLDAAPAIRSFFARTMPGLKTHRDELIVDVASEALFERVTSWNAGTDDQMRAERFHPSRSRHVPSRAYLIEPSLIRKIRYRPLDNRYIYADRNFIQEPGRILTAYEEKADRRCLQTLESGSVGGPVVVASNLLPDYHGVRGSFGSHVMFIDPPDDDLFGGLDNVTLSAWGKRWARHINADQVDVASYLLALGSAPAYVALFGDALRGEPPRFMPTLDQELFGEAVEIGRRILDAWCLSAPPIGQWIQVANVGTPLGAPSIDIHGVQFENGDRFTGINPDSEVFEISTYPVLERFLEARAHLPLSTGLASEIRSVAGAIDVLLTTRAACDVLLTRSLDAPAWNTED